MDPVETQLKTDDDASKKNVEELSESMIKLGTENEEEDECFLMKLPVELLDKIMKKLSTSDRQNARLVCKGMDEVVCCGIKFLPALNDKTLATFKGFQDHPVQKYHKELLVGDFTNVDYSWLIPSKLESVQVLHFEHPITQHSLPSVQWMIKQSTNLNRLDFKHHNFLDFPLSKLLQDAEVETICKQVTHLSLKATISVPEFDIEAAQIFGAGAHLRSLNFNCDDLAAFRSLQSLELFRMGYAFLSNIGNLPTTLKQLQMFVFLSRPELTLLLNHLVNLKKLWIHSSQFHIGSVPEDEIDGDVPLDQNLFEKVVLGTKIEFFHYTPIYIVASRRFVAATSLTGSNIVNFKWIALKQDLMVKIKRQLGFKRE